MRDPPTEGRRKRVIRSVRLKEASLVAEIERLKSHEVRPFPHGSGGSITTYLVPGMRYNITTRFDVGINLLRNLGGSKKKGFDLFCLVALSDLVCKFDIGFE